MDKTKNYNKMEKVLEIINSSYVTVQKNDLKDVLPVLNYIIGEIIKNMKIVDPLFSNMFQTIMYCGSAYDNLKVGKPEEFDLDLLLTLPKLIECKIELSNTPGFVKLSTSGWDLLEKNKVEYDKYKELFKLKDGKNYLSRVELMKRMESTVCKALNFFKRVDNQKYEFDYNRKTYHMFMVKSGPAITMKIKSISDSVFMDVDLVPVFKMTEKHWPPSPFKVLSPECKDKNIFLLVPKAPRNANDNSGNFWRLSFQEQERELIGGYHRCKPALRLLKKFRDTQNQSKICSYFIKSILLNEIDMRKAEPMFWNDSLSNVFMHLLKCLRDHLDKHNIPFYWYKKMNLLMSIDRTTTENFRNFITKMIIKIENNMESEPTIIAQYLLSTEQMLTFRDKVDSPTVAPTVTAVPIKKTSIVCDVDQLEKIFSMFETINSRMDRLETKIDSLLTNVLDVKEHLKITAENNSKELKEDVVSSSNNVPLSNDVKYYFEKLELAFNTLETENANLKKDLQKYISSDNL